MWRRFFLQAARKRRQAGRLKPAADSCSRIPEATRGPADVRELRLGCFIICFSSLSRSSLLRVTGKLAMLARRRGL
jgi:hypothetical protein